MNAGVPGAGVRQPQDPFERWAAFQSWSTDATNRLGEAADLAFWERIADQYDAGALAVRVPAVLERVSSLVPEGSSLLDVGAGTGAFSLPLASRTRRVTALDYSPAMLRVLRRKARSEPGFSHVQPLHARWEDADVEPHDVVLAANALYRTRDLHSALRKLVDTARVRGIIVWSVGRQDAPRHTAREYVQPGRYRPGPDYIHVLEGLFALDVFASVQMIEVDDTQRYDSNEEAAEGLLSWSPVLREERARVVALLPHLLEPEGDGWMWRRRGRVAIMWWEGPQA